MKKSYLEPDFELVKIGLVANAFIASKDVEETFYPIGGGGDEFEDGSDIEILP